MIKYTKTPAFAVIVKDKDGYDTEKPFVVLTRKFNTVNDKHAFIDSFKDLEGTDIYIYEHSTDPCWSTVGIGSTDPCWSTVGIGSDQILRYVVVETNVNNSPDKNSIKKTSYLSQEDMFHKNYDPVLSHSFIVRVYEDSDKQYSLDRLIDSHVIKGMSNLNFYSIKEYAKSVEDESYNLQTRIRVHGFNLELYDVIKKPMSLYMKLIGKTLKVEVDYVGPIGDIVESISLKNCLVTDISVSARDWGMDHPSLITLSLSGGYLEK